MALKPSTPDGLRPAFEGLSKSVFFALERFAKDIAE